MVNRKEIRNSTAEFLIFQIEGKEQGVEVYYKDKTVWCTQKAMGMLFDCSTDNIGLHLKNIFASGELEKESVTEKISATASDGKNYMTQFYNLDAVISVGYRVNSIRTTQFRQWATNDFRWTQKNKMACNSRAARHFSLICSMSVCQTYFTSSKSASCTSSLPSLLGC